MIGTEVQRIIILVGLAITGYLLIVAWNRDYMSDDALPTAAAERSYDDVTAPATGSPADDVPSAALAPEVPVSHGTSDGVQLPTVDAGADDLPDESLVAADAAAGAAESPASSPSVATAEGRLVHVETPMFNVQIDRLGGDIVHVELNRHAAKRNRPDVPFVLLDNRGGRTYVAQSGLVGPDGIDRTGRPLYRTQSARYRLAEDSAETAVTLNAVKDGVQVQKTFRFRPDAYVVDVDFQVLNTTDRPINARLFAQIKRDGLEPVGEESFTLGPRPYLGAALTTAESRYEKLTFDDLEEGDFVASVDGGWMAMIQHYFLSAWVGNPGEVNSYYGRMRRSDGLYQVGYQGPLASIPPQRSGTWHTRFFAGPKDQGRLEAIAPNLNLTVDYGFLWWLAVPLFKVLDWLHGLVGNWGIAIILLTVLVKILLYPLSAAGFRAMANMRRVAPQLKRLQERYADDRQKLSQEMMALYKRENANPLGGCIPMLLPMPIFLALYWVLFESVELRHAPFMLWINDLSAMDPWFVLPLLMGASMYVQQLLSPMTGDPMQVRVMKMMPVMFTVLFLFFPAGLVLYWLVNNVLSIAQQWYVNRQIDAQAAAKAGKA